MKIKIFEIGGSVRDELLGIDSKDKDFVVVFDDISIGIDKAWEYLIDYLKENGYEIFLETKDCYTIRAKFPVTHKHKGLTADFVIARKDISYNKENRKPIIELGTIQNDVFRRDFCCNALYKDENGQIVDLTLRGIANVYHKKLSTPLNPMTTFNDDPLRIFRAIRFAVTKNFTLDIRIIDAINRGQFNFSVVSTERVREELYKCFKHDTLKTLMYLEMFPTLQDYAFKGNKLWLMPTNKLI
jgi:poly(A) polymerase